MTFLLAHFLALLAIVLIAAGFIVCHFAAKHQSMHLKTAGTVLIAGGLLIFACTGYYAVRHSHQSYFDDPERVELIPDQQKLRE